MAVSSVPGEAVPPTEGHLARDGEVYGRHRHTGDCTAGGTGVREQRTGEDGAGAQGGVAGGAEAPGATGAPVERTGGREQTQPQDGGGSGAGRDGARRTAAFGSSEDRSCIQGGTGRDRADRRRAAGSPRRGARKTRLKVDILRLLVKRLMT